MLHLDPRTTALVLIDLQKGIIARPLEPHSGDSVVAAGRSLADAFRSAGGTVVLVNVAFSADGGATADSGRRRSVAGEILAVL